MKPAGDPTFEDAVPIRMDDRHSRLGENDLATKVGEWPQADEGMGEGGHHMTLHHCRRKRWGRGEGCAGNRSHGEAIRDKDANSRCLVVQISYGCTGRKVKAAGARVGNASVGGR